MEQNLITTKIHDGVVIITINNARYRNSLSLDVLQQLDAAIASIDDLQTTAIVVTSTGDAFASGADLNELSQLDAISAIDFSKRGQAVFQRIADAKPVTIAAINGYCMGGGLDLALACDIRVASGHAKFSHPGSRRGIVTGWGGTQRLPRLIGRTRALEMFITAGTYSSALALEMGLISAIGDPVVDIALKQLSAITQICRTANGSERT